MKPFPKLPRLNHTVSLDADRQAVVLRYLSDAIHALGTVHGVLSKVSTIDAQLAHDALAVAEHRFADIGKTLGISTNSKEQIEDRHARIRQANLRIQELETQIGNAASPEAVALALGTLEKRFNHWWRKHGFGHVSDLTFGRYGVQANLSCHLSGDFRTLSSESPESDKDRRTKWHAALQAAGFVLVKEGRDVAVVDCDASRETLKKLVQTALPSVKILEYGNHTNQDGVALLEHLKCIVYDFNDLQALPMPDTA